MTGGAPVLVLVIFLILLVPLCVVALRMRRTMTPTGRQTRDTRAWASEATGRPLTSGDPVGRVAVGVAWRKVVRLLPGGSLLCVGRTGSGKTAAVANPVVLEWDHGPVLVLAAKSGIVKRTSGWRSTLGTVQVFDPTGVSGLRSAKSSPLAECRVWDKAVRIGHSVAELSGATANLGGSSHWQNIAEDGVSSLFHAGALGGLPLEEVIAWGYERESGKPEQILRKHAGSPGATQALGRLHGAFKSGDKKLDAHCWSTFRTSVAAFAQPDALRVSDPSEIDAGAFLDGPNTIYCVADSTEQKRLAPVFMVLLDTILREAFRRGQLDRPTNLLVVLDDLAASVRLPGLADLAATVRELGITLLTMLQDFQQLDTAYRNEAGTIVNNHDGLLIFPGIRDELTLRVIEHVVGVEPVVKTSYSRSGMNGHRSVSDSEHLQPILDSRHIREIPDDEAILIYGGRPPMRVRQRRYYDTPALAPRLLPPETSPAPDTAEDRPYGLTWAEVLGAIEVGEATPIFAGDESSPVYVHASDGFYEPTGVLAAEITDPNRLPGLRAGLYVARKAATA